MYVKFLLFPSAHILVTDSLSSLAGRFDGMIHLAASGFVRCLIVYIYLRVSRSRDVTWYLESGGQGEMQDVLSTITSGWFRVACSV